MASVITHGLAAVIIGKGFVREKQPPLFWAALIGCSLLPDLDVICILAPLLAAVLLLRRVAGRHRKSAGKSSA